MGDPDPWSRMTGTERGALPGASLSRPSVSTLALRGRRSTAGACPGADSGALAERGALPGTRSIESARPTAEAERGAAWGGAETTRAGGRRGALAGAESPAARKSLVGSCAWRVATTGFAIALLGGRVAGPCFGAKLVETGLGSSRPTGARLDTRSAGTRSPDSGPWPKRFESAISTALCSRAF
jgi:hypothetical protein